MPMVRYHDISMRVRSTDEGFLTCRPVNMNQTRNHDSQIVVVDCSSWEPKQGTFSFGGDIVIRIRNCSLRKILI